MALHLNIVTPQQQVLSKEVDWVTLPGSEGELGILPEHIPLMSTLNSGVLVYSAQGARKAVAIHWGYAQVDQNQVKVLAELAEVAEEIDLARAQAAEQKAKEVLVAAKGDGEEELHRLKKYDAKLQRSLIRQQVAHLK